MYDEVRNAVQEAVFVEHAFRHIVHGAARRH